MKTQNTNQNQTPTLYIEEVINNSVTYYQIISRRNETVLFSDISLVKIAYKFLAGMMRIPTYKDGTKVVLDANKKENAVTQIVDQNLVELSKEYDKIKKEWAELDKKGQFNYSLYMEMLSIKHDIQMAQQKRDSLISINK